jgi:hypothetical protein
MIGAIAARPEADAEMFTIASPGRRERVGNL